MADKPQNQKPVEPGKEERAQLKKLMDSHMTILEHRLGRPAQMNELLDMLKEGEEVQQSAGAPQATQAAAPQTQPTSGQQPNQEQAGLAEQAPKILSMKVFYGMGGEGEAKKPDPNKILFYKTHDNKWYDTHNQSWCPTAPTYADHLPSRDLNFNEKDLVAAIAHGVMDDQDYESLDKAGMITDLPRQLWTKVRHLRDLTEQMSKSEPVEAEEEVEASESYSPTEGETSDGNGDNPPGTDVTAEFRKTAGVQDQLEEAELVGENLIEQIMEAAMESLTGSLEEQVVKILIKYGVLVESNADFETQETASRDTLDPEALDEKPEETLTDDDVTE